MGDKHPFNCKIVRESRFELSHSRNAHSYYSSCERALILAHFMMLCTDPKNVQTCRRSLWGSLNHLCACVTSSKLLPGTSSPHIPGGSLWDLTHAQKHQFNGRGPPYFCTCVGRFGACTETSGGSDRSHSSQCKMAAPEKNGIGRTFPESKTRLNFMD